MKIFHCQDLNGRVQSQNHPSVDDRDLGLAHMVHFHQHPGECCQLYVAVDGNGEAHGTGMVDNKDVVHVDVEGTVSRAGGKPVAAAAAVDMGGIADEGQEVWVEEGQFVGVGCRYLAQYLEDTVDRDPAILGASWIAVLACEYVEVVAVEVVVQWRAAEGWMIEEKVLFQALALE